MPGMCPGIFGGERNGGSGSGAGEAAGALAGAALGMAAFAAGGTGAAFTAAGTFAVLLDTVGNHSKPDEGQALRSGAVPTPPHPPAERVSQGRATTAGNDLITEISAKVTA
ncbi:MAG: hypothetical protein NVSMB18_31570 [Acetobacteraceae bacterium]